MNETTNALVLAGGGVAGIAWETGLLAGLADAEPGLMREVLSPTTLLVGTSAGSTVTAQIAGGTPLEELFERQVADETAERSVVIDLASFAASMSGALDGATTRAEGRRRLGAMALAADTIPAADRLAVIAARLPVQEWSDWPLKITAIDTATGELRVFDRESGVRLVDAVAASCAVPGIWPTVEIDGVRYMDGGTRTMANADLAAGCDRVLIVVPAKEVGPLGPSPTREEVEALGAATVVTVHADDDSVAAMGANPLDPESRVPAARAGRAYGRRVAAEVAAAWRAGAAR